MQSFTYTIADLHGNYKALLRALAVIRKHRGERQAHLGVTLQDTIVFLGDYIDRGWDSADVLEFFSTEGAVKKAIGIEFGQTEVIHLLGNHDDVFMQMLKRIHRLGGNDAKLGIDPSFKYCKRFYDTYGGTKTDASYLIHNSNSVVFKSTKVTGSIFPMKHLKFLQSLPYYYYDDKRVFVHGYCPRVVDTSIDSKQIRNLLYTDDTLWDRFKSFDNYTFAGRHIVHGHTPVETPELFTNRTNLDTNSWKTGLVHIGVFDNSKPGGPVTVMDTNDFTVSWFEGMKK